MCENHIYNITGLYNRNKVLRFIGSGIFFHSYLAVNGTQKSVDLHQGPAAPILHIRAMIKICKKIIHLDDDPDHLQCFIIHSLCNCLHLLKKNSTSWFHPCLQTAYAAFTVVFFNWSISLNIRGLKVT